MLFCSQQKSKKHVQDWADDDVDDDFGDVFT